MGNHIFTGSGVAIVTPMNSDGSVNYDMLAQLLEFHVANATDAIIVCGTTGESATLSEEEHCKVISFVAEKINGRLPVIAGTGSNDTSTAVMLSKSAQKSGADALLCVTPYYNKTSQAGLIKHYNVIADSVDLPMILYNVPSRTGCNIQAKTYLELCKHPNIVATKEASGNISQVAEIAALTNGEFDIYSGNDDQIVPLLSLGGKGVISVLSNILPKKTVEICDKFFAGDVAGSCKLQLELLPLINSLFCEVNPIPAKAAVAAIGYGDNYVRLPLTTMEPENEAKMRALMREQGLNV